MATAKSSTDQLSNKNIASILKHAIKLFEIQDVNRFKINAYQNTVLQLERLDTQIGGLTKEELRQKGFSDSMADKIQEITTTRSFAELKQAEESIPKGVVELLKLRGLGGRKIRTLWQDLGVTTLEQLLQASQQGMVSGIKGFGAKTQENIIGQIPFILENRGKVQLVKAQKIGQQILAGLPEDLQNKLRITGDVRRYAETVTSLQFLAPKESKKELTAYFATLDFLQSDAKAPFNIYRATENVFGLPIEVYFLREDEYPFWDFSLTAARSHLTTTTAQGSTLYKASLNTVSSEEEIYSEAGLPFIPAELREGKYEFDLIEKNGLDQLVTFSDLKGILHNHSTYSDGKNSVSEMADWCKSNGYSYLGMSDHSQTAHYAGGLLPAEVVQQQAEIDELNSKNPDFRILKGIESDILADGSLDYEDDLLKTFDFVVASVHSGLEMDKDKATTRLIKAIEHPATNILGHASGRLLLQRKGYPLDYYKILDACAANKVSIELNANSYRFDLDWRLIPMALERGIYVSINPDAHEVAGFMDMKNGTMIARKGGLTKEMTLNALSLEDLLKFFQKS